MKSFARIGSILIAFLTPAFVFAQTFTQQYSPFGGQNYSGNLVNFFTGIGSGSYSYGSMGGTGIEYVAIKAIMLINTVAVPLLFAVAFIMFLYGVAKAYIFSHGDPDEVKQEHQFVLWGVVGFAVMISLWGLVNIVANTFGLQGQFGPVQPSAVLPQGQQNVFGNTFNNTLY